MTEEAAELVARVAALDIGKGAAGGMRAGAARDGSAQEAAGGPCRTEHHQS